MLTKVNSTFDVIHEPDDHYRNPVHDLATSIGQVMVRRPSTYTQEVLDSHRGSVPNDNITQIFTYYSILHVTKYVIYLCMNQCHSFLR